MEEPKFNHLISDKLIGEVINCVFQTHGWEEFLKINPLNLELTTYSVIININIYMQSPSFKKVLARCSEDLQQLILAHLYLQS